MTDNWKVATLTHSQDIAENTKALTFKVEPWETHQSGQHYNVRLTAEDGYQAERDYSIASPPEQVGTVELGIEKLTDGEVSPYLHTLKPGDQIEIKGPIGGHFVWDTTMSGPLILIGGGSGTVPLMSILRHYLAHWENDQQREVVFIISAKTENNILYYDELKKYQKTYPNFKLIFALTREMPKNWSGYTRRVDKQILTETIGQYIGKMPMIYVCGPTPFVEIVAEDLLEIGLNSHEIFTERFG